MKNSEIPTAARSRLTLANGFIQITHSQWIDLGLVNRDLPEDAVSK